MIEPQTLSSVFKETPSSENIFREKILGRKAKFSAKKLSGKKSCEAENFLIKKSKRARVKFLHNSFDFTNLIKEFN